MSLIEVAAATDLPKSSAFRYLWTLEQHRYVERDPATGTYLLGPAFVGIQQRQLDVLRRRAQPVLEALRDELGETVNLGILDHDAALYLEIAESRHGVRLVTARGDRDPIHSTALGKALVARLPRDEVAALLARTGMERRTKRTITSARSFHAELARVAEQGFAIDDGENDPDGRCVAVAVGGTAVPAALSLSAPASRLPMAAVPAVAKQLAAAALLVGGPLRAAGDSR